ncbi:hypothetical protein ACOI22_04300 [Glaciecola sp. 2405UD65-10]|uniref:hypothetical protein n=1 Tax=Glaciecola sp. 2405UD65-10 TaxID=3397244 RepID=UPI003B5C41E7
MKFTEGMAIYAACLSTIVFFWNIVKSTPRYRVDMVFGLDADSDSDKSEDRVGVYISVKNPSAHTIHLSNVSLLYAYRSETLLKKLYHLIKYQSIPNTVGWVHTSLSNYDIDDKCPIAIEPGQAHDIFVPERVITRMISDSVRPEIKAVAQDQLWRNKYSSKFNCSSMQISNEE